MRFDWASKIRKYAKEDSRAESESDNAFSDHLRYICMVSLTNSQ